MRVYFLLSIGLVLASGCSSVSPFATTTQTPEPIGVQGANSRYGATGRSGPNQLSALDGGLRQQFTQTGPNSYSQGPASLGNRFMDTIRSASTSIGNLLTIKPKVIPASSPTSLASKPANIGADLHFQAAQVYESQQNIPGAISHFQKALEISPGDPRVLVGFGRLFDRQGDLHRAEGLYQQALQTDSDHCPALNALAICYAKQGNLDSALAHLYRATQLQPQNARYKNNMANVLVDAGRIDEAYTQLVSVHGQAGAHYNLGYLLLQQGRQDEARSELDRALQVNPHLVQARKLLSTLEPSADPGRPVSSEFETLGRFSVSHPYNPRVANPVTTTPHFGVQSSDQRSLSRPYNLPPL